MRLIEILHQEVSTNHDQDESGRSGETIKEVLAGGSRKEEIREEQSGADDDGADGPDPT